MVRGYVLSRDCGRLVRNAVRQTIDIKGYWKLVVLYNVYLGIQNVGFTYTVTDKRTSIVAIGECSSKEELINTIVHEAKHVQSHICNYYSIPEDGEKAAYLLGYIVQKMYDVFKNFI